jgi:hypothetical protein
MRLGVMRAGTTETLCLTCEAEGTSGERKYRIALPASCAENGWKLTRWQDQMEIHDGTGSVVAAFIDPRLTERHAINEWIDANGLHNVLTVAPVGDDLRGLAAREQPAPVATGSRPVWDEVIERATNEEFRGAMQDHAISLVYMLSRHVYTRATAHSHVIDDMRARDRMGRARYGVPLTADNGRNHLVDAYQEALDLLVYLVAAEMAQEADHE